MLNRKLTLILCLAGLLLAAQANAAPIVGTAVGGASYDTGTNVLSINGTISVAPGTLKDALFSISLPLVLDGGGNTFEATFGSVGTPGSLNIAPGLLAVDLNFVHVALPDFDGAFNITSYLLGATPADSNLHITGGSQSGVVSSGGNFSIQLTNLDFGGGPVNNLFDPEWFANSFTADARLEMETAPEPGSFLLVATGLGLMVRMGRRRQL